MRFENIFKELAAKKYYVFSCEELCAFFPEERKPTLKQSLCRWKKSGLVSSLRKNLYELTFPSSYGLSDMYLANKIYAPSVVSGFGQMYPVVCTHKGALFADKIDALLKKNRARHLFDIMFMLSSKYSMDARVLKILNIKKPPLEAMINRVESLSTIELKRQAEALRPFLFDENEAELIVNAKTIIPQLVQRYRQG